MTLEALRQAKEFARSEIRRLEALYEANDSLVSVQAICDACERYSEAEDAHLEALSAATGIPFDRS